MTEIIAKEVQTQMQNKAATLVDIAIGINIRNEMENAKAAAFLVDVRTERKAREEVFKPAVSKAKAAYDEVRYLRDKAINPLEDAEEIVKTKISGFVVAENARRDALQAKADAKFEKAVERSEATGKPMTAAPQVFAKVNTGGGATFITKWEAEITDAKAVIEAVAKGFIPMEAVSFNMPFFNKMASISKDKFAMPGVKGVKKVITRAC
jgi:hypothetical protein